MTSHAVCNSGGAALRLPAVFGDHMVLQRERPVAVWGWAAPMVTVTVTVAGVSASALAGGDGRWRVVLPAMPAGGPHRVTVEAGAEQRVFEDVMIGEVWLASGQSNMEWSFNHGVAGSEAALAAADLPNLRLCQVPRRVAPTLQTDCDCCWQQSTAETAAPFSATAFFFGRMVLRALDGVAVGLIHASWGGTPAEAWTSAEGLAELPEFADVLNRLQRESAAGAKPEGGSAHTPASLYNGMIGPVAGLAIRGVIWYQGESNVGDPAGYRRIFPNLIRDWRARFGQGDFPFYFCQIAPYRYDGGRSGMALREVQRETLARVPATGMAVLMDCATVDDIHPPYKQEAGERLALWALAQDYGRPVCCSGPLFRAMTVADGAVRVTFDHAETGLTAGGGGLRDFELAGADGLFHPAQATLTGDGAVSVRCDAVPNPKAVRYGWADDATASLFNGAGLPASPFRSDSGWLAADN